MEIERFLNEDPDHRCEEEEEEEEEEDECRPQTHVHEFISSTQLAEEGDDRHNHRFAGVSGEVIPIPGGHVHKLVTRTDFLDHFHRIRVLSGPPVILPDPDAQPSQLKHVHFVEGFTTVVDGHRHEFEFGTLVQALLVDEDED